MLATGKNAGSDPGYLYAGARLAVASEWEVSHPSELSADEAEFLRCSREAQLQREASELEAARKLADALRERADKTLPQATIAEALIRNWSRLREWLSACKTGSRIRTRLMEAARDWKTSGHDDSYLYTGTRLAAVEQWVASHSRKLSNDEAEFLRCSLDAKKKQEAKALEAAQLTARDEAELQAKATALISPFPKATSQGELLSRLMLAFSRKDELRDEELESILNAFVSCTSSEIDDKASSVFGDGFCLRLIKIKADFRGLNIPDRMPLIVPRRPLVGEAGMRTVCELLTSNEEEPARLAIVLTLSPRQEAMALAETAKKQIRSKYACDAVILSAEDLLDLSTTSKPEDLLRRLVLSQVDIGSCSPFIISGPAARGMFFGRESELREIEDHVENTSFAFIGGRRIGKSSILQRLHLFRLPLKDFYSLYFDCSYTPTLESFRSARLRAWAPRPPSEKLDRFADLLNTPRSNEKLVLLLDEADKLVPGDRISGWPVFNCLRALANSGRAQIVLSGERALQEATQDPTSPLFNFVSVRILGPLSFDAVEELITRPMKQLEIDLVDSTAIVRLIYEISSGHPNVVQRLCHRVIEQLNMRVPRCSLLERTRPRNLCPFSLRVPSPPPRCSCNLRIVVIAPPYSSLDS